MGDELSLGGFKSKIRPLMEEYKPPASIIVTKPAKLQEALAEASIDAKGNFQRKLNANVIRILNQIGLLGNNSLQLTHTN